MSASTLLFARLVLASKVIITAIIVAQIYLIGLEVVHCDGKTKSRRHRIYFDSSL